MHILINQDYGWRTYHWKAPFNTEEELIQYFESINNQEDFFNKNENIVLKGHTVLIDECGSGTNQVKIVRRIWSEPRWISIPLFEEECFWFSYFAKNSGSEFYKEL